MQDVQEDKWAPEERKLGTDEKTPLLYDQSLEDISTTEECRT
jgi:hypothetical protein